MFFVLLMVCINICPTSVLLSIPFSPRFHFGKN
uniref:Uncharacterized protein n=1 Tax=Arundo donax TaxID=35708 RepID=A0A0A9FE21_ARUDO